MISSLFGVVRNLALDRAIVEVGGVGLALSITPATSLRLVAGNSAQFFTSLVVREDSLTLFGFLDEGARALFELVQTVSGIGPRVAMSIVGALSPEELAAAVAEEKVGVIERVPGIGRKGAQRMILELKGKIEHLAAAPQFQSQRALWREQLAGALVGLGFTAREAENSVGDLSTQLRESSQDPTTLELGDLLKRALSSGKKGLGHE